MVLCALEDTVTGACNGSYSIKAHLELLHGDLNVVQPGRNRAIHSIWPVSSQEGGVVLQVGVNLLQGLHSQTHCYCLPSSFT